MSSSFEQGHLTDNACNATDPDLKPISNKIFNRYLRFQQELQYMHAA